MNPYTRPPPVTASPANSEQTNPTRTNNPRDRDVQLLRTTSPTIQTSGSSEEFANARQDQAQENNPTAQMQRLNQVIQNFHTKAALIILHSRVELNPAYSKNTDTKRINRWFNIELDETDDYREDIKRWKTCDLKDDRPPPLVIEVFLTTEQLQQGQRLVILDEDGKRWELTNSITSAQTRAGKRIPSEANEILLERWTIELGDTSAGLTHDLNTVLPLVYKKSIVLFRSLYTYCNFLPTWKLSRKLGKGRSYLAMKLGYRIVDGSALSQLSRPDNLETPLHDSGTDVIGDYSFGVTESPAGPFSVSVKYRHNCDFRIDDSEELLSSRFWGTEEDLFQPSLNDTRQKDRGSEIGSLPTDTRKNLLKRPELGHAYGSLSTYHQVGIGTGTSPISALRNAQDFTTASTSPPTPEPRQLQIPAQTPTSSSKTSLLATAAGRRSSFTFQPFKAPALSASPLSSSPLAGSPRSHSGRIPVLGSLTEESGLPSQASTARKPSSLLSDTAVNIPSTSSSPKPGKYSSSFTHRRARLSSGGTASRTDEDQGSSGRGSATSSVQPGSGLMAEAATTTTGTSSESIQEDGDNISDFLKMLDNKKDSLTPSSAAGVEAATKRTAAALNRFHRMRDSNAALSDSMSSSLMLQRSSSSSSRQLSSVPPMVGPTSFSTSSSPGKPISPHTPHTPFAPSRLSAAYSNDETEEQAHGPGLVEPASPSEIGTSMTVHGQSMAQIGAIPIPNSPRTFLPGYQRSSSAHRRPVNSEEELDIYGLRSASMGAQDRRNTQRDNSNTSGQQEDSSRNRDQTDLSPGESLRTERPIEQALSPRDITSRASLGRFPIRSARFSIGRNIGAPSAGSSSSPFGVSSRSPEPGAGSGATVESSSWNRSRPGSSTDRPENKFDEDDLPFALDKSDFNALDKPGKGRSN